MHSDSYFKTVSIVIIILCAIIAVTSYIDATCIRRNDFYALGALVTALVQILDMLSDAFFSFETLEARRYPQLIFAISISFILIPSALSLLQLQVSIRKWRGNDELSQWLRVNTKLLFFMAVICCNAFTSVQICCSNLFSLWCFDIPLNQTQLISFQTKRIYSTVFLEVCLFDSLHPNMYKL